MQRMRTVAGGGPAVSKFAAVESRDRIPLARPKRIEIIADLTARLPPAWYAPLETAVLR